MTWLATLVLASCPPDSPRTDALLHALRESQQGQERWRDGWSGAFGLASLTMLSTSELVEAASRPAWYGGAAWTAAGVPFVFLQLQPPALDCADDEVLEARLLALAVAEERAASVTSQLLNLGTNAAAGLVMGALLDDWVSALVNVTLNSVVGALTLATAPCETRAAWARHRAEFGP
jgi:hypothetical protein